MTGLEDKTKLKISREEIKRYLKDLKTGDAKSRAVAAYMLGTIGRTDKSIKKHLTKALNDKNWEVRKWAALSLGEIGEKNTQLIPIMIQILKREDSKEFRSHAAIILGELQQKAIPALPSLHEASRDENTRVREWATWALNEILGNKLNSRSVPTAERPSLSERIRFAKKELE